MENEVEKIAIIIIRKWLRKGNMARTMRDILPHSGLSYQKREEVARIVHDIVRYKRYYDFIMNQRGIKKNAENYVLLSKNKPIIDAPRDIVYSLSLQLDQVTPEEFIPIINREPEITLCINLNKISREEAIDTIKREGFKAKSYIPESAVITESAGRYTSLIKKGYAIVQDSSSQMIAKIVASLGDTILDYCAGSGGKSLAMHTFYPHKTYYAYDINRKKLASLKKRAEKWKMNIKIFYEKPVGEFSVVLVDAPCSGVGAAAKNPEAKYYKDFSSFSTTQLNILKESLKYVEKGGFLIYVVCSYTPQETDDVIENFLLKHKEFTSEDFKIPYKEYEKKGRFGSYIFTGDIFYISLLKRM